MAHVASTVRAQGDTQPPTVTGLSPVPGAISQDVTTAVTVRFSEAIQPASVAFVLRDSASVVVPASLTYDSSTFTVTLRPGSDLPAARTYTATLSAAVDLAGNALISPSVWSFSTGQPGFHESVVFSGLQSPTAFQFASDGRVFVAEKSGVIRVFDSLTAGTPTVFADLRMTVDSSGNRGLLGLALDPGFPAVPYVYVFYSYSAGTGGVARGRVSRLQASGNVSTGAEQVLVDDWYQRYPDQSVGNLAFGPDGALYAAAGDGAGSTFVDVGQTDTPSPDPLNEGGALRSQDLRTPADPVTLDGSVIRIQPGTGQAVRATTSMTVGAPTVDANGVKSYPVTSVYQGLQPQVVRVLEPTNPAPGRPRRLLYVLPVSAGVTNQGSQFGDGLEALRLLDVPNRFNLTLIAPSFNYEPWYGDNATDQTEWMETFIIRELVPWGDSFLPFGATPQRFALGFSKSGNGVLLLILRHPNVLSAVAAWDSPAQLNDINAFSGLPLNFGTQTNYDRYFLPTLVTADAQPFTSSNRLWISGDQSAWTADMIQLHSQLTAAGIPHTWVAGGTRVHSWSSGWLDGAVTALDAQASQIAAPDANEPRIIAYGLRSPRFAFRPGTPEIWVADKGASAEEINLVRNSTDGVVENFGWPCYEGSATTTYSGTSICSLLQSQTAQTAAPVFSYLHQQQVVPGNEAGVGTGAISGLAFYGSGSYPASYQGALFFADSSRNNIWVMFKDANGNPNPANVTNFVLGAASPVDLETGPGGDLFYADQAGGTIRRIQFIEPIGRSGGQPSGILPAGTTQTLVSLATDQNATCRYATTAGVSYASMPTTFATTGGTAHSTPVTGLTNGGVYDVFVRCSNANGDRNPDDYPISFSVGRPPAITSVSSTTLTVLTPGSFLVTATGTPTPSLTESGALPGGVTFMDNGNGTATLGGPPAAGTAGTYPITITASNGGGAPAVQSFTLTVSAPSGGGPANFTYVTGSVTGVVDFGGDTGATLAIPLHQDPVAGHLLICAATWQSATATASMSDPNNGTWTPIGTARTGAGDLTAYRGQMFYVPAAVNAATTVTLTIASAVGFRAFECAEYAYNGTLAILDGTPKYSTTPASGGVATVSGLTTSNSSGLLFAGCLAVDTTCSAGTGFTALDDTNTSFKDRGVTGQSFRSGTGQLIEHKVGVTAGAQSATFFTGTSDSVILGMVAVTANAQTPATITSANAATLTAGTAGSFTITTSGTPTPSLTETGALPSGVTFVNNGNGTATLGGTPAAGTAGSYPITITASNGVATPATQSFTLTVNPPPVITSANNTTFTVGAAGAFTVTSTGTPTPSLTETGALPGGVTFVNNGNGTATLSGTPAAGTTGSYAITITASNGAGTPATQSFTLTVNQAPAITSAAGATFTAGTAGSFTVTATGTPTPTVIQTGALPNGVTFVNNGNGTATLSGPPAAGTAGSYALTITASNGVGTSATQSFTLTVIAQTPPAITSPGGTTFTAGAPGSFTVIATGAPTPSLTETGALPSGVTFVNNGNGTATLSGTPAAGTGGSYAITITASNGVGTPATQSFTLTVNRAPAITSANNAAFIVSTAGSFTVTVTGTPTPTVTETGALPGGVTFVNNGNGTATLSGTPAAGTAGSYTLTITAANGVGTPATQSFTLTVNQTPAITSVNSATFTVGAAGAFTVTSTGIPTASLTETGALPGGVTFVNNGNGTATLSGTPAAGTAGSYAITITASNGVGTPATQSFALAVSQAPAITSANNATFILGTAGSFTVTATGTPAPAVTETGALPSGVTFVNNGNGTATLGGTPAAGTAGSYAFTITASNGVGTPATQSFTLTINQVPAITSVTNATFTVGTAGTFTVTATGRPTPSLTATGALPGGVTFVNNGNGTATLSGTPATGTAGSYAITITAANGVGTPATQGFTLTVGAGGTGPSAFAYVAGSVTGVADFGGDTGATLSIALHQNPGAGDLVVCAATWQSATATAAMSDPNNGTWTPIGAAKAGTGALTGYRGQMFYVPAAVNAPTTVTLTMASAVGFRAFECAEFSYAGTMALDGTPQYSTTPAVATIATVGGLTTSNSSDLLFAACLGVDTSCAVGTGFTALDDTNTFFKDRGLTGQSFKAGTGQLIEFKVGVAAGAQSATFKTVGSTDHVILGLVAF